MDHNPDERPRIIRLRDVKSTNLSMRERLEKEQLPEGSVIVADFQTSGRGQAGNSWESEDGKNLMFSLVVYPDCIPANRQFILSQIAALSVKETLDKYTDDIRIKWPNDIYHGERKICGMLIENDLSGTFIYRSILGIGINLNQGVFTSPAPNPVSLVQITGQITDREEVLEQFLSLFYARYLRLLQEKEEEIRQAYRNALYRGKGFYQYADETGVFEAEIAEIAPTGHLLLNLRNGTIRRYAFKEVSYQ